MENSLVALLAFYSQLGYVAWGVITSVVFMVIMLAMGLEKKRHPSPLMDAHAEMVREHDPQANPPVFSDSGQLGLIAVMVGVMWPLFHFLFFCLGIMAIAIYMGDLGAKLVIGKPHTHETH